MISFSSSSCELDQASHTLRRSDRKRTKKIFKEDLVEGGLVRHRTGKKHKSLKINYNLDTSFNPNPVPLPLSMSLFQLNNLEQSLQALKEMKQAVNRQQIKYEELLEIKLIAQSNRLKQHSKNQEVKSFLVAQNNFEDQQNLKRCLDESSEADCQGDLVRMVTGTDEMYLQFQCLQMDSSDSDNIHSAYNGINQTELGMAREIMLCRRKQSAIMLSDNYENDELMYNMEQLQPQWLREQYIEHVDW